MGYFLQELVLTIVLIVLTIRLLSSKHCVERFSQILYSMLFYISACYLQLIGMDMQRAGIFCYCALAIGGVAMCWFSFQKKQIYWVKGLNLYKAEALNALADLVDDYIKANGLNGRVAFDYRRLIFDQVEKEKEKQLVDKMNRFIYEEGCADYRNWKKIIYVIFTLQIVALAIQGVLRFLIF